MRPVAIIPSLCTLGNLFCGFLAIAYGADAITELWHAKGTRGQLELTPATIAAFHGLFERGCWLIFAANIFDALDGRLARMTKTTSSFGGMLDSVADMLTFGAAPAFMLKFLFESERLMAEQAFKPKVVLLMCFLYACCAAMRLARFTAETDDDVESHDFFKGLPSPAAAGFVASGILFFLYLGEGDAPAWLAQRRGTFLTLMLGAMPVLALLMISHVKYVHVVNRFMRGRRPYTYVAQLVAVLLLLFLVKEYALVILCMGYVIVCPLISLAEKIFKKPLWPAGPAAPTGETP